MNLTTDPWIPIIWTDGQTGMVSLHEIFQRGHQIQDFSVRPHERIALMRLLICIAQAALDGPSDFEDWNACKPRIKQEALDYLKRWQHVFELFGNGQRFLQVNNLKKPANHKSKEDEDDEGNSTSKLDLALATGNNTTLFDNAGGADRTFSSSDLALKLLAFQCFSPGGRIGVALWNERETAGKGSSEHAPCLVGSMLHAILRANNIYDTLHLNLISKRQAEQIFGNNSWGNPLWEQMPTSIADVKAVHNASRTYLGRLVPLTRLIRFHDKHGSLILANGLEFPSYSDGGWREPTATIVIRTIKNQPTRFLLSASVDRSVWRELHALTVKFTSQNSIGGIAALQNISETESFDLWVGGIVANKAKLVDTTESVFHIPAAMLNEPNQRVYENGVQMAEAIASRVRRAVSVYHKELGDNLDRPEMKYRRNQIQNIATTQYWTYVENHVPLLLQVAINTDIIGLNEGWYKTEWGQSIRKASYMAYDQACPRETARQIKAYALGLSALHTKLTEQSVNETRKEVEE